MSSAVAIEYETTQNASPVCLLLRLENSRRLASLWDLMHEFHLWFYFDEMLKFEFLVQTLPVDSTVISQEEASSLSQNLERVRQHCKEDGFYGPHSSLRVAATWFEGDGIRLSNAHGEAIFRRASVTTHVMVSPSPERWLSRGAAPE